MDPEKSFLIGVATSGYQSEGGYNGPGEPKNNWGGCETSGRVQTTGIAVDFWNRYREDFRLTRGLGLNAFRLGLEWARIQPSTSTARGAAPEFDNEAIDAYALRIAACREEGLEPVVTLQHFTHPAWLGIDAWLMDETIDLFEIFVTHTITRLNDRLVDIHGQAPVHWYITINEPNMLVLNTYLNRCFPGGPDAGVAIGLRAYNRLLAAHVRAYNAVHDLYESRGWSKPLISMNTFCSDVYWSDVMLLDLLCLRTTGVKPAEVGGYFKSRAEDLSLHLGVTAPYGRTGLASLAGDGLHAIANFLASRAATEQGCGFFLRELERAKRDSTLDYLGVDYYDPFLSHALRMPDFSDLEFKSQSVSAHLFDVLTSKWWDWHFLPEGLTAFCSYYAKAFPGMGILIAENGMSQRCSQDNSVVAERPDKILRSDYLEAHLREVRRMLDQGVPLIGYLHWSLTDNYEWGSFTPRFGLYRIDFAKGLERLSIDHLGDNPSLSYARLARELGLGGMGC